MIIFNLYAIPVAVICFIVAALFAGIMSLIPGVAEDETLLGVIMYGVITITAGLCEAIGLKGRIFFIPIWLLGFVLTFATVCTQYGWAGFGVMVLAGIGLMVCLYYLGKNIENKEWSAAPNELAQCQRISDSSSKDFWEHFQKAFFVPTVINYTSHIHYHNYQCLELLKKTGIQRPVIDSLMNAYAANTHDDSSVEIEDEQTAEIQQLIAEKIEALE